MEYSACFRVEFKMSSVNTDKNSEGNKRFASLSEQDFDKLITEKDSKNTRRATDFAVKTFQAYLSEKGENTEFEAAEPSRLDCLLRQFYTEARSLHGEL